MPLKYRFKAREEIPGQHQALYVERDGAWVLDVEGAVEKTRLDEFPEHECGAAARGGVAEDAAGG